jgi:hypothetical protein
LLHDPVQNFKQNVWPRLAGYMDDMLGFSQAEYEFILNAGRNARICKLGTREQENIFAQFDASTEIQGGFFHLESQTVVVSYENPGRILSTTCHEIGHAFAHQRLEKKDLGESFSMFFETVCVILAVDMQMLSKSEVIEELNSLRQNILFDFIPIRKNLILARDIADNPALLDDARQFGFVEYTKDSIAEYIPRMKEDVVALTGEYLETRVRGQLSAIFGVIDRSTGEYCNSRMLFDPVFHDNHGISTLAALMVAQRFIPLSVLESPSQVIFSEIANALRDYGETCLHHFADVRSGAALTALQWYHDRITRPFRH